MKKLAAFLMILSVSVFAIGCGGKTKTEAEPETPKTETPDHEEPKTEAPKTETPDPEEPAPAP